MVAQLQLPSLLCVADRLNCRWQLRMTVYACDSATVFMQATSAA